MDRTEIFDKVKRIIGEQMGMPAEEIHMDSEVVDDLGFDDIDLVEVIFGIEDEFMNESFAVKDDELDQIKTVKDIVGLVEKGIIT